MINYNGIISSSKNNLLYNNRAFQYGDGIFETMKIINNQILFFEDHYFRLLSGMRIIRMEIPTYFTMTFLQEEIVSLALINNCSDSCRARFTVFRNNGGLYLPENNSVSFLIDVANTDQQYTYKKMYEVDIYKEYYISKQIISTIKSTNKLINIIGSIYAKENELDNCFLLNESKNIVEALQGNIFILIDNKLITPPLSEGCLNGIMRKKTLRIAKDIGDIEVVEEPISPFYLQKADEIFITNVIIGIQPITKYRKKEYKTALANMLLLELNSIIFNF